MATLTRVFREYWSDRPMELAAALSYYTLLSLAPLVLLSVAVSSLVFERAAVEGRIVGEIRFLVGNDGADVVQAILKHGSPERGVRSALIGVVVLLVGATSVFVQLQDSMNRI